MPLCFGFCQTRSLHLVAFSVSANPIFYLLPIDLRSIPPE